MVAHYQYYPRSVSWQVASVLNPSLQNSMLWGQPSSHSREKREREGVKDDPAKSQQPPQPSTACQAWRQEEAEESRQRLTLPPQYVSPGELRKTMPKYSRLKGRPKASGPEPSVAFSTASPALGSPRYDLAAGSPRSQDSARNWSTVFPSLPAESIEGCKATPISAMLLSTKLTQLS